jgi:hypothetical protein
MDFLLGILVGLIVSFFYWQSVILKAINDGIDEAFAAELEPKKLVVTVEQEGDQFLLYQTDNNRFLMQGTSLADFQKRLPSLNIDVLSIENSSSMAAQALLKTTLTNKESHEDSNNK